MTDNNCGRQNRDGDPCGLPAGWGTDHVGEGACKLHGGASLSGEDNPMFRHGIYSDVVREEDQAVLDALEDVGTAQKLEETLNLQVMKLRRAVELLDDPDREDNFWDGFSTLVDQAAAGEDLDPSVIRELTRMLDTPHSAQRDLMDLIRKTATDLHKITDGETIRHEHGLDDEELGELQDMADDLF